MGENEAFLQIRGAHPQGGTFWSREVDKGIQNHKLKTLFGKSRNAVHFISVGPNNGSARVWTQTREELLLLFAMNSKLTSYSPDIC